jgi:transposase InsO family protein
LYYKHKQEEIDLEIRQQIETVLVDNPSYGHKRIALMLKINKKCVRRVMNKYGIKPYRRRLKKPIKTNDLKKPQTIHENLIKNICPIHKNVVWVSDFTYIKYKEKFVYLSTVMDLYTREIVGLNVARHHNKELVITALSEAISIHGNPQYIHSDQGSEYDCFEYTKFTKEKGIKISMSKKSSPWENSYQESFYSHFKLEIGDMNRFETFGELLEAIYLQIYYYNNKRIHTKLKTSPVQFKESRHSFLGT